MQRFRVIKDRDVNVLTTIESLFRGWKQYFEGFMIVLREGMMDVKKCRESVSADD